MQPINNRVPNRFQKILINGLGVVFRGPLKRGRGLILKLIFPEGAFFDYDFTILNYSQPYSGNLKFGIDNHIFFFQIFEPCNVEILKNIARSLSRKGQNVAFLDIGGNVGSYSHFLRGYVHEIHCFEPHPELFKSLYGKWELYQDENFHVYQFGLGLTNCKLEYYEPATHNTGTGSFVLKGSYINSETPILLPLRRGDEVVKETKIDRVSLLKIDVEGFEPLVLKGLEKAINRDRPIMLIEMSLMTRQVMVDYGLQLESLLCDQVTLLEIKPIGKRGKFKLKLTSLNNINPEHHDLLVIPNEHINDLFGEPSSESVDFRSKRIQSQV